MRHQTKRAKVFRFAWCRTGARSWTEGETRGGRWGACHGLHTAVPPTQDRLSTSRSLSQSALTQARRKENVLVVTSSAFSSVCDLCTNLALNLSHPAFLQFVNSARMSAHGRFTVSSEVPVSQQRSSSYQMSDVFSRGHDPPHSCPQGQTTGTCWIHLQ